MARIYLHYRPNAAALTYLLICQTAIHRLNPDSRPIKPPQLHLTLLHIGIYQELLAELQAANPKLAEDNFRAELQRLIADSLGLMPSKIDVEPAGFAAYGSRGAVSALNVKVSPELAKVQKQLVRQAIDFLRRCGIPDPAEFMARSPNLRHSEQFKPHISLVRDAPRLPEKPESRKLELTLQPIIGIDPVVSLRN